MDCQARARGVTACGLLMIAAAVVPAIGCSAVATVFYVVKGTNVSAEFDDLKAKRVVIVCRTTPSLHYSMRSAGNGLARQIGQRLTANVRKIEVVDPREVEAWIDENSWDEFTEVGKAMDAEMVVGVDLERFSLYQSQTLYQGEAVYSIQVFDMTAGGEVVYEKHPPEARYPPNAAIETSQMLEAGFRREFIADLAEQVARHFYDHDSRVDFAKDSQAVLD